MTFVAGFSRFWSLTHQLISFVILMFLTTLTRQISSQLICHTIYVATQTFPYFHKPYFIAMKKKLSP
ncbi:TPA: hypothetical protein HI064_15285 [Escherichia coli]|nr:hypothetical protein [Escherichia coli]